MEPIKMEKLRRKINELRGSPELGDTLPKTGGDEVYENVECFDRRGTSLGEFNVTLEASTPYDGKGMRSSRPHRVHVQCHCGSWIPAGRIAQHIKLSPVHASNRNPLPAYPSAAMKEV